MVHFRIMGLITFLLLGACDRRPASNKSGSADTKDSPQSDCSEPKLLCEISIYQLMGAPGAWSGKFVSVQGFLSRGEKGALFLFADRESSENSIMQNGVDIALAEALPQGYAQGPIDTYMWISGKFEKGDPTADYVLDFGPPIRGSIINARKTKGRGPYDAWSCNQVSLNEREQHYRRQNPCEIEDELKKMMKRAEPRSSPNSGQKF